MYYIGLDIHNKTISYCVKDQSGQICVEGTIPATRTDLDRCNPYLQTVLVEAAHLAPRCCRKRTKQITFGAQSARSLIYTSGQRSGSS